MRRSTRGSFARAATLIAGLAFAAIKAGVAAKAARGIAAGADDLELPVQNSSWEVAPGPFGRGDCLIEVHGGETLIVAPPGVPLAPPELVSALIRWRFARARHGAILDTPQPIELNEVLQLAPEHDAWIRDQAAEEDLAHQETSEGAAQSSPHLLNATRQQAQRKARALAGAAKAHVLVAAGHGDHSDASSTGDGREIPTYPASPVEAAEFGAHEFAHFVGTCPGTAPVRRLARAADDAPSAADLRSRVDELAIEVGYGPVREALTALLFARAQSRSWRYTKPFVREHDQGELADAIDSADSPQALRQAVLDYEADSQEDVTDELLTVLHERAQSSRWRKTRAIRVVLAARELAGVRTWLFRRRAQLEHWLACRGVRT